MLVLLELVEVLVEELEVLVLLLEVLVLLELVEVLELVVLLELVLPLAVLELLLAELVLPPDPFVSPGEEQAANVPTVVVRATVNESSRVKDVMQNT